ncbi:DUF2334 domain-containing protein [bacterium]|nr:DUF2334 domain-containing protein [bacterium]MBU1958062.1 DUF2334 domain-containing protein [bacterium]
MNYKKSIIIFWIIIFLTNFASAIVYEDAEATNSANKWQIYDADPAGATVTRVFDATKQSNVMSLNGSSTDNGYILGSFSDAQSWNNTTHTILKWDMKVSENYVVFIRVGTQEGYKYLYYTASDVDYGGGADYIHFGLGSNSQDGSWRTFTRDLEADLKKFDGDNKLLSVHAFLLRGSVKLDNIEMLVNPNAPDVIKPVITLLGDASVTVNLGTNYSDTGATALDDRDGDISANITTTTNVDTSTLGTYYVSYNVSDASNNQAVTVKRVVSVVESAESSNKALILYDTAGAYGHVGKTNAIFLENLLGHFDLNIVSKPAIEYVENDMNDKKAVFYIGSTYAALSNYAEGSDERKAYEDFYKDIATKDRTVVWMNYNLQSLERFWKENNLSNTTFDQKFGLRFNSIQQLKYNRVEYKNTELFKGVIPFATPGADLSICENEGNNRYACALELNYIDIVDSNKAGTFATAYSTLPGTNTPISPYITKGGKFWFVGDIPFSYMSEEDRYLAFSDVLHDMLGILHEESHKAIMRLEDVDARTDLSALDKVAKYMKKEKVPFSVATIPVYEDPLGIENNGVATTELLSNSTVGQTLKSLSDEGLVYIIQHGTSHQYHKSLNEPESEIRNPYNGLSGDDFEFMRVVENADLSYSYLYPIENDSGTWAKDRIQTGKNVLTDLGLTAFAWEAPHYMAGPNHYRAIADIYPVQYARVLYYPYENSDDPTKKYQFVGQFFPYIIKKDSYGITIIPENIHNIEDVPNPGYRQLLPADMIHFATKLKVVRDGVASFYYHPYLGDTHLKEIIPGLQAAGYEFVAAPTLVQ